MYELDNLELLFEMSRVRGVRVRQKHSPEAVDGNRESENKEK